MAGGSSGIGLATARWRSAPKGRTCCWRPGPLEAVVAQLRARGVRVHARSADIGTKPGQAAVLDAARQAFGCIDVLVNNAGNVGAGRLEDTWEAEIRVMIDVDLLAPSC